MKHAVATLVSIFVLTIVTNVYAHEGEDTEVAKVTIQALTGEESAAPTATAESAGSSAAHDAIDKEVDTINQEVTGSAPMVVTKAGAVGLAVILLGFFYLRRRKSGGSR